MKVLAESEPDALQIVQFKACGHIGLRFNNMLLTFSVKSFKDFVKTYGAINFDRYSILFPDDRNRLIMNTVVEEVQFCFTCEEFERLQQALTEASLILEANTLIQN
ncbi:hypothetical protein [Rhodohalobacter sp. 614A]|uniref:hypothetical protein n=1 Tax=Rhodohalobacter sp. 614A TaxID=2908649 RepID=UPI001F3198E4|nr:hypothetical protein [Rhodohalobacter sp. 614A]